MLDPQDSGDGVTIAALYIKASIIPELVSVI